MGVYRRGHVWWYEFVFGAHRFRESTKQGNKRVAQQMEAARRTQLAKGELGITERKPAPTLKEFAVRFESAVRIQCSGKPKTIEFYAAKVKTLIAEAHLGNIQIDAIDEAAIESYVQARSSVISRRKKGLSPGSINRELATLGKNILDTPNYLPHT